MKGAPSKPFNTYEIQGDTTILFDIKEDKTIHKIYIDTNELDKFKKFNKYWCASWRKKTQTYYAVTNQGYHDENGKYKQRIIYIHKMILDAEVYKDEYINHKDHDTLNNTKDNLEVIENNENLKYRNGKNKNNKSGVRNVCWSNSDNRWIVQLQIEGRNTTLGRFKYNDLDKAEQFAREKRQFYYGKFAGNE
jgi:hypothetical protein